MTNLSASVSASTAPAACKMMPLSELSTSPTSIAVTICKPAFVKPAHAGCAAATASAELTACGSDAVASLSNHDLDDLTGTTAARSRKMTEEERKVMLHKRRLRNRASAARSREKRSRTLNDLTAEVEDLMKRSAHLAQQASQAVEEARKLRARNAMLSKENELLKSELNL